MKTLLSILTFFIGALCVAQTDCKTDVVITVTDASLKNPVEGAQVQLGNGVTEGLRGTTDATGSVTLSARCDTTYTVKVYKEEFEPSQTTVTTRKDETANVAIDLIPMSPIKSSGGYIDQFIVRVYNPVNVPIDVRFGPTERTLVTHTIRAGEVWESEPYQNISDLLLWISTGRVTKKYMTKPGKAYQIEFNRRQRCYLIKEVDVHK